MIVWLAALFITAGLTLAGSVAVAGRRPAPAGSSFDPASGVVPSARTLDLERSVGERLVAPATAALGAAVRRFTPAGVVDKMAHTLRVADIGRPWTPELVVGLQAAGCAAGTLLALAYLRVAGGGRNNLIMGVLLVAILTFGPNARVKRAADERRTAIRNELPDVLDQLTVTVEAGMSFDGALQRAGQEGRGLLARELLRCVHDMQLGLSRGEALSALVERTDVEDLKAFVSAVRQAEKHGFPLATILRVQSQEMREKRRARAEERAMQVPVKITFPLVFCILPALFVVILGPALLQIRSTF